MAEQKTVTFEQALSVAANNLTRTAVQITDIGAEIMRQFEALAEENAKLREELAGKNPPIDDDIK